MLEDSVSHIKIRGTESGLICLTPRQTFLTVSELIDFYCNHSLVEHFRAVDTPLLVPAGTKRLSTQQAHSHVAHASAAAFTLTIVPAKKASFVRAKFPFEAGAEDELSFLVGLFSRRGASNSVAGGRRVRTDWQGRLRQRVVAGAPQRHRRRVPG